MFQFQLAEALGKTRKELLSAMSGQEFSYWKAYYSIYPMPQRRADMRSATILQGVLYGPQKKRWTFKQCLLNFLGSGVVQQTEDQMKSIFRAATKHLPERIMPRPKNLPKPKNKLRD